MIKQILFLAFLIYSSILPSFTLIKKENSVVEKTLYGKLPDGREVNQYTLMNKSGATIKIINFGAIVTSLSVADRNGKYEDIVLGYDSLQGYLIGESYFGAIVGRYGNRIGKGKFKLDGEPSPWRNNRIQ